MILVLEIMMLVVGLMMLVRGKGFKNDSIPHPQYRWLGAFLLTLIPVGGFLMLALGFFWAMTHPEIDFEKNPDSLKWPAIALEVVTVLTYAGIWTLWEKSIVRKATARKFG